MSNMSSGSLAQTVAATSEKASRVKSIGKTILSWFPGFALVLVVYTILAMSVDMHSTFAKIGNYKFSWLSCLWLVASMTSIFELLRVSKPGIDNTREAIAMGAIFVVFLVILVLASTGVIGEKTYGTTEFAAMTVISLAQTIVAFMINARTLKRTIDHSGDHH